MTPKESWYQAWPRARKLRIRYPGAIYHVMNRRDRREAIFADDADRQRLLETLTEACPKTGWKVHAYGLVRNHFHLVIETPQPNLPAAMEWRRGEDLLAVLVTGDVEVWVDRRRIAYCVFPGLPGPNPYTNFPDEPLFDACGA